MAFTNSTTHYGLPQWIGTDKPTYLVDQNNAYATIDTQLYNASTDAASAVATANSAASSATTAAENAATALSTANTADGKADSAITQAELAQTAAGAAQTAAAAAQTAAAANNITNLAPAYDATLTYNVDDLVTAQGKLYKCIVAVTTPMDFDINYWDDVTTSEVYARIGSGADVYTKSEADALFETQTDAAATYETITNVANKDELKLAAGSGEIKFGIDGNGNYGYIKDGESTVNPFSSAADCQTACRYASISGGSSATINDYTGVIAVSVHMTVDTETFVKWEDGELTHITGTANILAVNGDTITITNTLGSGGNNRGYFATIVYTG